MTNHQQREGLTQNMYELDDGPLTKEQLEEVRNASGIDQNMMFDQSLFDGLGSIKKD